MVTTYIEKTRIYLGVKYHLVTDRHGRWYWSVDDVGLSEIWFDDWRQADVDAKEFIGKH